MGFRVDRVDGVERVSRGVGVKGLGLIGFIGVAGFWLGPWGISVYYTRLLSPRDVAVHIDLETFQIIYRYV